MAQNTLLRLKKQDTELEVMMGLFLSDRDHLYGSIGPTLLPHIYSEIESLFSGYWRGQRDKALD